MSIIHVTDSKRGIFYFLFFFYVRAYIGMRKIQTGQGEKNFRLSKLWRKKNHRNGHGKRQREHSGEKWLKKMRGEQLGM